MGPDKWVERVQIMRDELRDHILGTLRIIGTWVDAFTIAQMANTSVVSVRNALKASQWAETKTERRPTVTRKGVNGTHQVVLYRHRGVS
jgi:hypothetical protein